MGQDLNSQHLLDLVVDALIDRITNHEASQVIAFKDDDGDVVIIRQLVDDDKSTSN